MLHASFFSQDKRRENIFRFIIGVSIAELGVDSLGKGEIHPNYICVC